MIGQVKESQLAECVQVIRDSFQTVADTFGFTVENAPRFTAFATTLDRLNWQMHGEKRPMFACMEENRGFQDRPLGQKSDPLAECSQPEAGKHGRSDHA